MAKLSTIPELFQARAASNPHAIAVVFEGASLSYGELDRASNRLARVLVDAGAGPERVVALALPRSPHLVVAILAVLKAGSAYLPIDPAYPAPRIEFMLADAAPILVLGTTTTPRPRTEIPTLFLDDLEVMGRVNQQSDDPLTDIDRAGPLHPLHPAYVIYTSGSSGRPKGVVAHHHNVLRLFESVGLWLECDETQTWSLFHSSAFDASVLEMWGALLHGGRLLIVPYQVSRSPEEFLRLLIDEGVTILTQTPSAFYALMAADEENPSLGASLGLRAILLGGEVMDPARLVSWYARHDEQVPKLFNLYGPTETTVVVTYHPFTARDAGPRSSSIIGVAYRDIRAYVLDRRLECVPHGESGELYISGAGLTRGYLGHPQSTAERFVADPFGPPGSRMYRTGDTARWNRDGQLEFLGRADEQVKVRGFRIEPGEVEAALATHPGVRQVVVLARQDRPGDTQLVAYVLFAPGHAVDAGALRQWAAAHLPDYMVPAAVVVLAAFPLTPSGKLDRRALPAPDWQRGPGARPRTALEEALCEAFADVLRVPEIGIDQSFSDRGGNSVNAITLMYKMRKAGLPVTLRDIMHCQTVERLVQDVLRPSASASIATAADLESFLFEQTGRRVTYRRIALQQDGHIRPIAVLLADIGMTADTLTGLLQRRVHPDILPHYVCAAEAFNDVVENAVLDEAAFYARLGLRPIEPLDIAMQRESLEPSLSNNDRSVKKNAVLREYPLCAMQRLQIAFTTPASVDILPIEHYVDLALLQKAYGVLIEQHGLLRSIAVESGEGYCWREHEHDPNDIPSIPLIDLTAFQSSASTFQQVIQQMVARVFDGPSILHQLVLVRKNLKEHFLVLVSHHVISDRVTAEVIKRQIMNHYQDLLHEQPLRREQATSFEAYTRQLARGPQRIAASEIVRSFRLEDFHAAKQAVKALVSGKESQSSYTFTIAIPLQGAWQADNTLEVALCVYAKGLQGYFGIEHIPSLFVCDGRQYEGQRYYDIVGEFTDMVPLLMDAGQSSSELTRSVVSRLDHLKQHNVNFLHLLLDPVHKTQWPDIGRLMDAGEQFECFDMLMFNFLGNGDEGRGGAVRETMHVEPHPLPIQTLLNCITSVANDTLVFTFRTSYVVDIPRMKTSFRQASDQLPH